MFTVSDVGTIYNFMKILKDKGFLSCVEPGENTLEFFVEFSSEEEDYIWRLCEDWMILHSNLVTSYLISYTDDHSGRFTMYLKESC